MGISSIKVIRNIRKMSVISYKNFDFTKLEFSNVKASKTGPRTVYFNYPNQEDTFFQTPKVKVTFNPYDTNFCVTADEALESKLREFETHIINNAVKHSSEWFGGVKTKDEVESMFISLLSKSSGDFPPFVRINFTQGCEIYNNDAEMVDNSKIIRGTQVRLILKFVKLYIKEKDGGGLTMRCNFDLNQVRISEQPEESKPTSYAFVDSDEE